MKKDTITYTIKFSKMGINQYATVTTDLKNKIIGTNFYPSYINTDKVPLIEGLKTLEEIINIIAKFSYDGFAEVHLINNLLPLYYNNKKLRASIDNANEEIDLVIEKVFSNVFKESIVPIMIANNWKISTSKYGVPVLIYLTEGGEWDNIKKNKDSILIDYLGSKLDDSVGYLDLTPQHSDISIDGFRVFMRHISIDTLKELGLFVQL